MSASSENEPVNLLALDGGGIRGVSELVILDEVMKAVQQKGRLASLPKPCDYFHLVGGTSTGGLVAIMLGRLGMGTKEALAAYDSFASDIFSKRRMSLTEKYKAKALEDTVQKLVRAQEKGSVMRNQRPGQQKGHAFVCTMPAQRHKEMVCLRTYEVAGDKYPNCLIYEAARATTAATTYFKPMAIKNEEGKEEKFVDAALGTNNPVSILWDEAINLFGKKRRLGCVVSLGTGSRKVEMAPGGETLKEKVKFLFSAIKVMKEIGTDSERDHLRWQAKFVEFEHTYFRLNVDGGAQGIELSDWQKIEQLKARTWDYLQDSGVKKMIDDLAEVLLGNKNSGLNLGHGGGLSKETTIPAEPKFVRRGKSSNIFTGRQSILNRLDKHFGPRQPGDKSRREFHLRGMGGVGKTQIALKFTERNEGRFHVFWVDATDAVTMQQSYHQIATTLFGPGKRDDPVQDVVLWLQKNDEEWLLVFDNAPAYSLARYLPDGNNGNILYTSRHRNLEPRLRPECVASIETMDAPEAILLLLRSAQEPVEVTKNRELARAIVNALGFLPLAIDQAGAYIHMAPCPLGEYLAVFNAQKEDLLRSPRFKGSDEKRHIAVYATFNISHRAIKAFADKKADLTRAKDAEIALKLLNMICFYHNEGSICAIFGRGAMSRYRTERFQHFPLKAGEVELESLIETSEAEVTLAFPEGRAWLYDDFLRGMGFLQEFSLVKFDVSVEYINMHILVHEWARDRLDSEERSNWGLAAKALLMDSIRFNNNVAGIKHRDDVIPHFEACLKHVTAEQDDLGLESEYLSKMAQVFQQASRLDAAETALTKALQYRRIYFGTLHPGSCAAISQLASVYKDQGMYGKAEEMLLEVIDRRKLYLQEEKWQASFDRELTTADDEVHHEPPLDVDDFLDDKQLRKDLNALSNIYLLQDNFSAAADVQEELLRWKVRTYGEYSQEARVARSRLKRFRGDCDDGEEGMTLEEAAAKYETANAELGQNHHSTVLAEQHLARILLNKGEIDEALKLLWHVYHWRKALYGEGSLKHAEAACKVAQVLCKRDMLFDAIALYEQAHLTYGRKLGLSHPITIKSLLDLAKCFAWIGEYRSAVDMMDGCLEGLNLVLGKDHHLPILCYHFLHQFRQFDETVPDYIRVMVKNNAIQANRDALGQDAPAWMQKWEPAPTEPLIQAHLDRGEPVRSFKMERNDFEGTGLPLYKFVPIGESLKNPKAVGLTLQWQD